MTYLIGLDIGTTNLKAIVCDVEHRTQTVYSCLTRTHHPRPGWAEYYADEIWADAVGLLRQAVKAMRRPSGIAGIAVASMGEAGLLVDARGCPLTPIIAWFDSRTEPQSRWWEENVGREKVYSVTGHPIHPSFGVNKLIWFRDNQPEAYHKAAHWLSVEDFILLRLSSVIATDYSVASRTMAFDIGAREWSSSLLSKAGIARKLMPPAYPGGTVIGEVTSRAAAESGLPKGTPVAIGGHDHVCASLAAGAYEPGSLLDSTGTSESLILTTSTVLTSPDMCRQNLAQECHVVEGRYGVLAGFPVAGYVVEWTQRLRQHCGKAIEHDLAEAAEVAPGSEGLFFLPHLRGAGSPSLDPACRGALVGLSDRHGWGHVLRASIEGVCYEMRSNILALETALGREVEGVYTVGKVTRSDLWLRLKADIAGKQLMVLDLSEAAGTGAALLAGIGARVFTSPDDAVASLGTRCTVIEPRPDCMAFYQAQYDRVYNRIYPALRDLFNALGEQSSCSTLRG